MFYDKKTNSTKNINLFPNYKIDHFGKIIINNMKFSFRKFKEQCNKIYPIKSDIKSNHRLLYSPQTSK